MGKILQKPKKLVEDHRNSNIIYIYTHLRYDGRVEEEEYSMGKTIETQYKRCEGPRPK